MPKKMGSASLLLPIADELEKLGLPHEWVRCVIKDNSTTIMQDTAAELAAQQAGAWYEDGPGLNWLHYPARFFKPDGSFKKLSDLSPDDAATLLEEVFHAWLDQCAGRWANLKEQVEEDLSSYFHHVIMWWLQLRGSSPKDIKILWKKIIKSARGNLDEDLFKKMKEEGLDIEDPPDSGLPKPVPGSKIKWAEDWTNNAKNKGKSCESFCRITTYKLRMVNSLVDVQTIIGGRFTKPDPGVRYDLTSIADIALKRKILDLEKKLKSRVNQTFTETGSCKKGCECIDSGKVVYEDKSRFTVHTDIIQYQGKKVAISWRVTISVKINLGTCVPEKKSYWF